MLRALRNLVRPRRRSRSDEADPRLVTGLPARYYRSKVLHTAFDSTKQTTSAATIRGAAWPTEARSDQEELRNHGLDWKQIYQVHFRLARGDFSAEQLEGQAASSSGSSTPSSQKRKADDRTLLSFSSSSESDQFETKQPSRPQTLVQISVQFIFTADRNARIVDLQHLENCPRVEIYRADGAFSAQRAALKPVASIDTRDLLQRLCSTAKPLTVSVCDIRIDASGLTTVESDGTQCQRLAVFLSTGQIGIYSVPLPGHGNDQVSLLGAFTPSPALQPTAFNIDSNAHVVGSAFHGSVLVSCTRHFSLSLYSLSPRPDSSLVVFPGQVLKSHISWWPASITLRPLPSAINDDGSRDGPSIRSETSMEAYRLCVAYCTPSYPSSFTVGLQEIIIQASAGSTSVLHSRHTTALPRFQKTPLDTRGSSMFKLDSASTSRATGNSHERSTAQRTGSWASMLPLRSGSVSRAPVATQHPTAVSPGLPTPDRSRLLSITFDEPFLVVGSRDNLLEVFELVGGTRFLRRPTAPTGTSSPSTRPLRLLHRASAHGHTGSVESVALEEGRLVSGSQDGSVIVWSLGDHGIDTDADLRSTATSASAGGGACSRPSKRRRFLRVGEGSDDVSATSLASTRAFDAMHQVITLTAPAIQSEMDDDGSVAVVHIADSDESDQEQQQPERYAVREQGRAVPFSNRQAVEEDYSLPSLAAAHLSQIPPSSPARVAPATPRTAIRHVSTSFDKIVSIVAAADPLRSEAVQVWSFVDAPQC